MKNILIILAAAVIVALPFVFRKPADVGDWRAGDPVLVVITPHNEACRREFADGFSRWHRERYGRPVKLDWRVIGGTTEIMRYLSAEYAAAAQACVRRQGGAWPANGADLIFDRAFNPQQPPPAAATNADVRAAFERQRELFAGFRGADDPAAVTCGIDLFFGGGTFDHDRAGRQGLTVPPWTPEQQKQPDVAALLAAIPERCGGEIWRSDRFFGNVLSTFGICYNRDRLRDLGLEAPPAVWRDLASPRLFGQVGLSDPTKSGSVAKAFEMIIHEQCRHAVEAAGFSAAQIAVFEASIAKARLPPGQVPTNVPAAYQTAVEQGWVNGVNLLRLIGANARYFTDGAGKVPVDVGSGILAAGVAIDFYGRFQAETERAPDGTEHMGYVTPVGGSSVSADPISLLRGAPHRELAVRFITYVLSPAGQQIWNYRAGTPGGPIRFTLRRLPIRRDFYPSDDPALRAAYEQHAPYMADNFADPRANPYAIAEAFTYQPRWTGAHFAIQRDLVRAMCLDSGDELRAAWRAILGHGGPERNPAAMAELARMPEKPLPLTWRSAIGPYGRVDRNACLREWTAFFRTRYDAAREAAEKNDSTNPGNPVNPVASKRTGFTGLPGLVWAEGNAAALPCDAGDAAHDGVTHRSASSAHRR